jgi:hypothetical protein
MSFLFVTTLFVSATLLFWVQPMIAKMLLPLLGGVPAVWNICMVFFQAMLLAGYTYAHLITTRLNARRQLLLHAALLLLAVLSLPIGVPEQRIRSLSAGVNPSLWLLGSLFAAVGLPFFVVSASGPLLQRWFSLTRHASAKDPYFLYVASNAGSLFALLGYPVLLEPYLRLREQSWLWVLGYGSLAVLILVCAVFYLKSASTVSLPDALAGTRDRAGKPSAPDENLTLTRRLRWVILAFVPSSLLLGVTNYLGTDIASIPLLWVIPLALYLLTFVFVFARRRFLPGIWLSRLLSVAALAAAFSILSHATQPVWFLIGLHLALLWLAAMVCHGRLAEDRPGPARLTEYYFWMSVGGVLGGLFNALVAPGIFQSIAEYPLAMVLACLLRPAADSSKSRFANPWLDYAFPVMLAVLTACLAVAAPVLGLKSVYLRNIVVIGVPAAIGFTFVDRPVRFGLGLGAILLVGWLCAGPYGKTLHIQRNFFGVSRVTESLSGTFRYLVHGNTLHGQQFTDPKRACEPLTYYHRTGPLGDIFGLFYTRPASDRVAAVGLGAGSMACYAEPNQRWTFYEIDPAVICIAQETDYFSYWRHCSRAEINVVVGDARLRLREARPREFGLIVLDAFNSDVVPVHLLTREAIDLYLSKLAEGGLLAFHISNRYLDLEPVVAELARNANLVCRSRDDWNVTPEELANGKEESHWVVLARRQEDLGKLNKDSRWLPLDSYASLRVWTDDFSNILGVFKWR